FHRNSQTKRLAVQSKSRLLALLSSFVVVGLLGFAFGSGKIGVSDVTQFVPQADAQSAQVAKREEWSRTKPYPRHDVYFPGSEELKPDEMRIIACGTGMPTPRLKQAAACFLVELGNGDKFIFDMGEGSYERISALGIPLDQLDKVFLGHLHLDHAGDFPAFYFTGPVNNRLQPVRLWGPNGSKPGWGTKAWVENMEKMWAWEAATRGSVVDPRGLELKVTEFDWTAMNAVIFDENDVVIRTVPAIHGEQSVSFILEWNGLKFAFSSDTLPSVGWRDHTKGADIAIHECFLPPRMMESKLGMEPSEAIFVGTQGHTSAQAFGKIMSLTKPRLAVCYHFQNDHDTAPAVLADIRKTYDGPLDLAIDFMVWNVTRDEIRTRMAVPNHESFPAPPQREKQPPDSMEILKPSETTIKSIEPASAAVTNKQIEEYNKKNGTNIKPGLTGIPFK
ncbi:MAG: guanitoxin biosynthesis MBL fold metallo-hydrolase GntH, partial [Hyphomicrobiales bacterium]